MRCFDSLNPTITNCISIDENTTIHAVNPPSGGGPTCTSSSVGMAGAPADGVGLACLGGVTGPGSPKGGTSLDSRRWTWNSCGGLSALIVEGVSKDK